MYSLRSHTRLPVTRLPRGWNTHYHLKTTAPAFSKTTVLISSEYTMKCVYCSLCLELWSPILSHQFYSSFKILCQSYLLSDSSQDPAGKNSLLPEICFCRPHLGAAMLLSFILSTQHRAWYKASTWAIRCPCVY